MSKKEQCSLWAGQKSYFAVNCVIYGHEVAYMKQLDCDSHPTFSFKGGWGGGGYKTMQILHIKEWDFLHL